MKYQFLTFLSLFCSTLLSFAQSPPLQLGYSVGYAYNEVDFYWTEFKKEGGFYQGIKGQYGKKHAFCFGINYLNAKSTNVRESLQIKLGSHLRLLEVPLGYATTFASSHKFNVQTSLGLQPSFILKAWHSRTNTSNGQESIENLSPDFHPLFFSGYAGVALRYRFHNHWIIQGAGNYVHSLTYLWQGRKDVVPTEPYSLYSPSGSPSIYNRWTAELGVFFEF